ncbi:MAG TPA: TolC family protein [Phycisphaerales bacterium]
MATLSRVLTLTLVVGTAIAVSGCKVGPDYSGPPTVETPASFAAVPAAKPTDVTTSPSQDEAKLGQWWMTLGDEQLASLVDRAVGSNLDLKLALSRVREARALRGSVASDWFPQVNTGASYSRSRSSNNTVPGFGAQQNATGVNTFGVGLEASWELDFWGRTARAVESVDAQIQQTVELRRDVLVLVLAEVASSYIDLRGLQERLAVVNRAVGVQEESLKLTESRFKAGLVGELDVAQARAQLEIRRSQVPGIRSGIDISINRLSVLLGRPPRALAEELAPFKSLPTAPTTVGVGLPSELLQRRPDIRAAERALAARTAAIGVATADLYPRFSITGALGLQSAQAGSWFDMGSRYWSIAPGVQWPILDWGKIRSNIDVRNEQLAQALITYEQTVLRSFEDVEGSLLRLVSSQEQFAALSRAVDSSRRAVQLAQDLYQTGNVDFRTVLENQRTLYDAEDQAVVSHANALINLVALYRTLGGGWEQLENPEGTPPIIPSSTIDAIVRGTRAGVSKEDPAPPPGSPAASPAGER